MTGKQRFINISEGAELLHVSEISLRRWTNSGKLRCFRVGGRNERRFLVEDLIAFMPSEDTQPEQQVGEARAEDDTTIDYTERHISLFFRDAEEQWKFLRPYIVDHLNAGAPVIYLQRSTSSHQPIQRLHPEAPPLDNL